MSQQVIDFINQNWDGCVRNNMKDEGTLIGMPYSYTIPAIGHFEEMYYWDTYFTNLGLLIGGRPQLAKNNVDNMLYLVNRYGFMPNGNRKCFLNQSQPPFLSEMVRDIYEYYKDPVWLLSAYGVLKTEYEFWQTRRSFDIGLNHYGGNAETEKTCTEMADYFKSRVKIEVKLDNISLGKHCRALCESGWDMNPRFGLECDKYAPVDLNSLLFMLEKNMSYFANELNIDESDLWEQRAQTRKTLMLSRMNNGGGILLDYMIERDSLSEILSAASFFPLYAELATNEGAKAMVENLSRLEEDYGILTCEKNNAEGIYQWDYPNGWACLQYIVVKGLDNYGFEAEANRIAQKYIALVDKVFDETGKLWEKYNVVTGSLDVNNEYKQPAMLGWSAGVYMSMYKYLEKSNLY
ncbi:MAG: trehalase family glycosidase [Clostridiales bacterium]|nr:trehalase family glycosidase [Clostridiales bacterium]